MVKKLTKVVIALALVVGIGLSAKALAVSVAGGTWNYGVGWNGTFGFSYYHHPSRSHKASVRNSQSGYTNSQRAAAGNWARSSLSKIPPTGLEYFYGF